MCFWTHVMEVYLFLVCIFDSVIQQHKQEKEALAAYLQFECKGMKEEVSAISHLHLSYEICLKQMSSSTNLPESF